MADLLGYSGNLKPLSITQDATVRAPKQKDTSVAPETVDNSDVRKWKTLTNTFTNTMQLIGTVGNVLEKEKREKEKQRRVALERFKSEFSTVNTQFKSNLTASVLLDRQQGKRTDYSQHLQQFNSEVLERFGISLDDNGDFRVTDSDAFAGMDYDTKQKAIAYATGTGYGTFKKVTGELINSTIETKKELMDSTVTPIIFDTVSNSKSVEKALKGFKSISTNKGLEALGLSDYDVRTYYYKKGLEYVKAIKDDKEALREFIKNNQTTDKDILKTPEYGFMMLRAKTFLGEKVGTNHKKLNSIIKQKTLSGEFSAFLKDADAIRIVSDETTGTIDVDTKSKEYKKIEDYLTTIAEANNFDLTTAEGRRASLMEFKKKALESESYAYASGVNQFLGDGGILNKEAYDKLPDNVRKHIRPKIEEQITKALYDLSTGNDDLKDHSLEVLNSYKTFNGTTDVVKNFISTQRSEILNAPIETKDGVVPAIVAKPTQVAMELSSKWEKYPKELKDFIPAKEKELYELSTVVAENPALSRAYSDIVTNPESVKEIIETAEGNAEYRKAASKVNKEAAGYGKKAEDYFGRVYALTRDVNKAEEATKKIYGLQKVTYNFKISPKLMEFITANNELTYEGTQGVLEQLHKLKDNTYKDYPVYIIDLPGNKVKIVYHNKEGAEIPVTDTQDKVELFLKRGFDYGHSPKFKSTEDINTQLKVNEPWRFNTL